MLSLSRVRYLHRGGDGVREVNLSAGPGEVVALVGQNGAGKTTLLRLLLGMLRPQSGSVSVLGRPLARLPRQEWSRVGHLIDSPLAYPELTTRENLRMAARLHHADPVRCVDTALERWGLQALSSRRLRHLSLGNRQRVGLAVALQHTPDLVVLDEPGNSLDLAAVVTLREALAHRAAEGAAVLVSSHHLDEAARIADRIVVMHRGRLIGGLAPDDPDLEHAYFEAVRRDEAEQSATTRGTE